MCGNGVVRWWRYSDGGGSGDIGDGNGGRDVDIGSAAVLFSLSFA